MWTGLLLLLPYLLGAPADMPSPARSAPRERAAARDSGEILFMGLGTHRRPVSTSSAQAQRYFDQGLNFLFAFNHDEAIRAFTQATRLDPRCAMAWWGIAIANGPHINNPMVDEAHAEAAWKALAEALKNSDQANPREQALIRAAQARYANPQPADRHPLDAAYADAMRQVWQQYPEDADIGALFAEAMMDLRPWDLWMPDGKPQPGTLEIVSTLEKVIKLNPNHPLGLHLYIHAVEASPYPEKADVAANRLRNLQPGLGHMVHMPSHIDVRRGRWKEAILANERAIEADRRYREQRPQQGFYRVYMLHNHHMLAYAAMMRGQSARAIGAIDAMVASMPEDWKRQVAPLIDGFVAMPTEARVRFGRWDEILATPEPPDYFPLTRALRHAARGIAYAAKNQVKEAQAEQETFQQAQERVPKDATVGNNTAADILAVATHMLAGEILYRAGETEKGLQELREAVRCEDRLRYDEPPDWILPVRHALGAALMQSGRFAEATQVYQADLAKLPENGWSLYGLSRSLEKQGEKAKSAKALQRFRQVWKEADVTLTSSCFCQPGP